MKLLHHLYHFLIFLGVFLVPLQSGAVCFNNYESQFIDQIKFGFNSEEHEWLSLFCLKENDKLPVAPNSSSSILVFCLNHNPQLVEAWKAVKDLPESVRKNTGDLEIVSDYMKRSGKSADDIAGEIPSNVTDSKKWLGNRKIEPFLSQNPQINSTSAPAGYQIYEVNGSKYIRRVDVENPYTPQLTVNENGVIVKYTKPARISVSARFSKNLEDIYGALPTNRQRHHSVPDNVVRNSPLYQEAIKRRLYDLDRGANGRYLAETAEDFVHDASGLSSKFTYSSWKSPKI